MWLKPVNAIQDNLLTYLTGNQKTPNWNKLPDHKISNLTKIVNVFKQKYDHKDLYTNLKYTILPSDDLQFLKIVLNIFLDGTLMINIK